MNIMRQPAKLKKGDRVALLAPSMPCDPSRLLPSAAFFEELGLEVEIMESCRLSHGYFSGNDEIRARDIMKAFTDPSIKGVFAIRGGYGAQRILPLLDYSQIAPKIFAGYSDITALHTVFNQRCGFITYHAPMAASELYEGKENVDPFTLRSFLGHIMEGYPEPQGLDCKAYSNRNQSERKSESNNNHCIQSIKGQLCGGNLSVITSSIGSGSPYEIDTCGKILFLEDIQEAPYRIDRMLLQLRQAGKFDNCRAIILGSFKPETTESIKQAIEEVLLPTNVPLWTDLSCGHTLPTLTLPLGTDVAVTYTYTQ